jgi:HAD superfamily phosphoserine phosphatase-like hydrolase
MNPSTIAIFDFDATLVAGDSLWPFLVRVAGRAAACAALAEAVSTYLVGGLEEKDSRSFIKASLLSRLLKGRSITEAKKAALSLRSWIKPLPTLNKLNWHFAQGHHVVIATGGLDIYMPILLHDIPHHAILSTEIGVEDGCLTGVMTSGNCVRERKAERVAAYMRENGPFEESWAYGNFPHDIPMLQKVQFGIIV